MEIRGQRECQSCGERWSYYDTGSVTCPACGSIRSVGVDERTRHTDGSVTLDLATAQSAAADDDYRTASELAREKSAEYIRVRGFIDGGRLRPLDDVFVAAQELRRAAAALDRALDPSGEDRRYFLALLQGAPEGARPGVERLTDRMRPARGLGAARAVDAYIKEVSTWQTDRRDTPGVPSLLARLRDHVRRVEALDGDVDPVDADRLVTAAQALGRYVVDAEASDREEAQTALDALR
jgi:uncharacterized Zn finger protein (UPF0148 family)